MDPCPFVRILVGNLALKLPPSPKPAAAGADVHPSTAPCYCKIRLNSLPPQTSPAPLILSDAAASPPPTLAAAFHLSKLDLNKLSSRPSLFSSSSKAKLRVAIYRGRSGMACGFSSSDKLIGEVVIPLEILGSEDRPAVLHNGWVSVHAGRKGAAQLNITVRAEPDPRFVFQFDGEPECSPQVQVVQGSLKQPMFTCKFCCRNASDLAFRSLSMQSDPGSARNYWVTPVGAERERVGKERKGWSLTVHDLSGSPVALASMVTPFVASPGSDRVSRSNPGAWLILRPGEGTWKPWGRLEAWRERERERGDCLGYRFQVLPDTSFGGSGVVVAESVVSAHKGGKFVIDMIAQSGRFRSPACSPRSSGDLGYGFWPVGGHRGFVMSASLAGEGKCSKPTVEVGVGTVGCAEDAAAFVALAAAVDLSMDACRLFSHKLRKELLQADHLLH